MARFGIFLGYRLSPGCRWNGEYLVGDLADFVDLDLSEDASARGVQIYEGRFRSIFPAEGEVRFFECQP